MGMSLLLFRAKMEVVLPAIAIKHLHSNVLFHPKHEDATQENLQLPKGEDSAEK